MRSFLRKLETTQSAPPLFDKYPLLSQKKGDFLLFKKAFNIILNKEHLTEDGLRKIAAIKASIN